MILLVVENTEVSPLRGAVDGKGGKVEWLVPGVIWEVTWVVATFGSTVESAADMAFATVPRRNTTRRKVKSMTIESGGCARSFPDNGALLPQWSSVRLRYR